MSQFKDGADWMDLPGALAEMVSDEKFKEAVERAWEGRDLIDDEIKDISIPETMELGLMAFNEMMAIVQMMKE